MGKKQDDEFFAAGLALIFIAVAAVVTLFWAGGKVLVRVFLAWRKGRGATRVAPVSPPPGAGTAVLVEQDAWTEHCERIEQAWQRGDYDWARLQLQKISYSMLEPSVTDRERAEFKALMTRFAAEDPLYGKVMERIRPMIAAAPGIVQSTIYKGQPDDIKEQMRYVLYFAESLGELVRHKKGSSYRLYLPGQITRIEDQAK